MYELMSKKKNEKIKNYLVLRPVKPQAGSDGMFKWFLKYLK